LGALKTALDEISPKGDTIVGTEVWIGINSMILLGIKIGDGAIIAARSVVSKNIGALKKIASE
jgi:acetyltransferase-like isoleucine patch superfamily enzyme